MSYFWRILNFLQSPMAISLIIYTLIQYHHPDFHPMMLRVGPAMSILIFLDKLLLRHKGRKISWRSIVLTSVSFGAGLIAIDYFPEQFHYLSNISTLFMIPLILLGIYLMHHPEAARKAGRYFRPKTPARA